MTDLDRFPEDEPESFRDDLADDRPTNPISPMGDVLTLAGSLNARVLRELLANRNFVPLWIGQLVSYLGDQFMLIAVLAVIRQLSGGNSLGIVLFAVSLGAPQILFGLIGGVLVDKLDRKWTMIVSDLSRAAAMFAMLLVAGDPSRAWIFYPAIFVIGTAQMLFYPARASAMPSLVRKIHLGAANALLEAGFVIALIFGSGGAGILIEKLGPDFAFAFNGCAFLFSALMIFIIRIPHVQQIANEKAPTFEQVWRELREGLAYIWNTRSMRYIMGLSVMVAAGLGAVTILVFEYLNAELKIGADGFGIVIGVLGIGIVIGGILIQRLSKYLPTNRLVGVAILLQGLAVGAFVLHPQLIVVLFLTAMIGFSLIVARAILSTLTQAIPPEELRGRVQSAFNLIFTAPLTGSIGLAALLLSVLPRDAVMAGFCIILIITAWLATNMLRGIDEAIYGSIS